MTSLQTEVLHFIKTHDLNPKNSIAEKIPEANVTESLAQEFSAQVLQEKEISAFHAANEILFEFIPPSKRDQFLNWLAKSCQKTNSALCENGEASLLSYETSIAPKDFFEAAALKEHDLRRATALGQIKDLDQIPSISSTQQPNIYQKLKWLIEHARAQGEIKFADALQSSLDQGKLKYVPDLKMANAFADPRRPGVVVFGEKFFERTWAHEIQGLDGKPILITDDEVVQRFNDVANMGQAEDSPMRGSFHSLQELQTAGFNPRMIEETRTRLGKEAVEHQKKRYAFYHGTLPIQTFPRNMPSWIIFVAHEIRHTMQLEQDRTVLNPEWVKGKNIKGLAYYGSLSRFSNSKEKNNPTVAQSGGTTFLLRKEADVTKKREEIGAVREREATDYGVRIAKKLVNDWAREQK